MDENSVKWNSEWNFSSSCQKKKKKRRNQKSQKISSNTVLREYDTLWKKNDRRYQQYEKHLPKETGMFEQ